MREKLPKWSFYNTIKRAENGITEKMNKRALKRSKKDIEQSNKLFKRQTARRFNINKSWILDDEAYSKITYEKI